MREILFRGKRVDNGEWVEGSLVNNVFFHVDTKGAIPYIIDPYEYEEYNCMEDIGDLAVEVTPETVGQFTGILSKHGIKIFDGDILQGDDDIEDDVFHVARIGQSDENRYECFLDFNGDNKCWMPFISYFNRMEIIGNIHDNPEMLT